MADFFEDKLTTQYSTDRLTPNDEGEDIFGAWVSAEFQNRSKIINGTNFFTFAPTSFLSYYWNIVKYNLEWYYGHVWGVHNKGIFSSKSGAKICKMSAQLTTNGGYRFEGDKTAEKFLSAFNIKSRLERKLKAELPLLNAIGFCLAKVDLQRDRNCDITFVAGNKYFAQIDNETNVTAFYALIKIITADVVCDEDSEGFYLVEERYYKKGKPIQRYRIYRGPIIATSPMQGESGSSKGLSFEELPEVVQIVVRREIGEDNLNKEFVLPFATIGAAVILNTFAATGMEEYKQFADSTLADIHTALYNLDWTETLKNEHKYISQDFVSMPGSTIPQFQGRYADESRDIAESISKLAGFNKRLVKRAVGVDPENSVPFVYSPTLKIAEYNADIDHIHAEIASGAQFSPATVSNYLKGDSVKTATEVRADETATQITITEKRGLIINALDKLFAIVLEHYHIDGKATMIFNNSGSTDTNSELDILEKKQRNGWISQRSAILQANPTYSQEEADKELLQIQQEQSLNSSYSEYFEGGN